MTVVLVPMVALGGILYAVAPFVRRHVRWPLAVLALAAAGSVVATKLSGDSFRNNKNLAAPQIQEKIVQHQSFGNNTMWFTLGLAAAVLLLTFAVPVTRAASPTRKGPDDTLVAPRQFGMSAMLVQVVLGVVVIGLAAASMYYVFRAGDSGAHMVWDGF
jgi:hypothetical protein